MIFRASFFQRNVFVGYYILNIFNSNGDIFNKKLKKYTYCFRILTEYRSKQSSGHCPGEQNICEFRDTLYSQIVSRNESRDRTEPFNISRVQSRLSHVVPRNNASTRDYFVYQTITKRTYCCHATQHEKSIKYRALSMSFS